MDEISERLLQLQNECTLCWVRGDGSPAATVVSFVWHNHCVWMTALAGSGRMRALARAPRAAVVVSGKGTPLGEGRCLSLQGRVQVNDDPAVRQWFFPALGKAVLPQSQRGAALLASAMQGPENLVLAFVPDRAIPWDSHEQLAMAGRL